MESKFSILTHTNISANDGSGVYLKRLHLIRTPWFGIFLHRIYRQDIDRFCHSHPWTFSAIILKGGYEEEMFDPRTKKVWSRKRKPLSFRKVSLDQAHRIAALYGKAPTWSLVFRGPRRQEWGFYTDRGWIHWEQFVNAHG